MGYLTVLYVRLDVKFGDLQVKDSYSFRNGLIQARLDVRTEFEIS